jgi:hypothetical protein
MKLEKIESFIEEVKEKGEEVFETVIEFVKEHKKLIFSGIIIYLIYKFLFTEEEEC